MSQIQGNGAQSPLAGAVAGAVLALAAGWWTARLSRPAAPIAQPRRATVLVLLAIAVLYMGIYPKPFTDVMHASVTELLRHVAVSKLN